MIASAGLALCLLCNVAWADTVKFRKGYTWSRNLHFVDSKDNPPHDCSFNQERDCAGGKCLTGAIGNYTTRLGCTYDTTQRGEAVKFLIHFLGDLTQPLHTCQRLRGGNDAKVTFDGKQSVSGHGSMNLHGIWDYSILEKLINTKYGKSVPQYLDHLASVAKSSDLAADASSWTACLSAAKSTGLACAMSWAADSDAINCGVLWSAYDENPNQDFGGKYYEAVWPILEQQLLKAGVRMAAFFEHYATRCDDQSAASKKKA